VSVTTQPQDAREPDAGAAHAVLDTRGLFCPEPVMLLHGRVRAMQPGEELTVLATDPSTQRDIARFCEFLGHALLASETRGEEFVFRIRKGG
jgi:tRNA 2-thiouridine synthesizing protein A